MGGGTPIFEATELFERGTGFATDVVQKEMYTFPDKKGRSLSLRPEATPSVIRAYLEHSLGRRARPGLLTLNPPPQFDLVIVDEAHHARNPDTKSYQAARFLCESTEAVLFMTAFFLSVMLARHSMDGSFGNTNPK